MRYTKVKACFRYAPDRLYRVLLVPEQVDLLRLAQIIGESVHVEWEHLFEFRKGNTHYVLDADDDLGSLFGDMISKPMQDFDISALGKKAVFEYDFGDGWLFDIQIYKRTVERDDEKAAWILEGAGQGIWEDYIGSLYAYFDGRIDDDFEEPEDSEYGLPWNFKNKHFRDFDKILDLTAEQEYLDERLKREIVLENKEAEDIEADAIMDGFLAETDGMDRLGTDKALHKWVNQTLRKLQNQYGEPHATMLVLRMLIEEQQQIAEVFENEEPF